MNGSGHAIGGDGGGGRALSAWLGAGWEAAAPFAGETQFRKRTTRGRAGGDDDDSDRKGKKRRDLDGEGRA